jgi:hypothetical protein
MQQFETITQHGTGFWGTVIDIKLTTVETVYLSRTSKADRIISSFRFGFRQTGSTVWDSRSFSSEADRERFFMANVSELRLKAIEKTPEKIPVQLVQHNVTGALFSSFEIPADYIRMAFDQHYFTFYVWPVVRIGSMTYQLPDLHAVDILSRTVGKTVKSIEEFYDFGLVLELDGDASIEVPLADEALWEGPELAEYQHKGVWVIWRAGEEPYI